MSVLGSLVGLQRIITTSLALMVGPYTWDYHDVEWFALEMNGDHSVVYETAPEHCILNSLVDYEG